MSIKLGNTEINALGNGVNKAYLGAVEVFGNVFTSLWETTGANETIQLPTLTNYRVDWGDGSITTTETSHEYATANQYIIKISGNVTDFAFDNTGDKDKIINISNWGRLELIAGGLHGSSNLDVSATDKPIINTNDLDSLFSGTTSLVYNNSINSWDMSGVVSIKDMFSGSSFNQEISSWDVSIVENMQGAFANSQFSQSINSWNVGSVTNMASLFNGAMSFDQPLNSWNVSNVESMFLMFFGSTFNQDLSAWVTSSLINIQGMFQNTTAFNQPINSWDVSNVENMQSLFVGSVFNQPLNSWTTSSCSNMGRVFQNALVFNQDISAWDFSSVTDISNFMIFKSSLNYDLSHMDALYNRIDNATFGLVFANMVNVNIGFGTIDYTSAGATARASTISKGFVVTSGVEV